MDYTVKKVEQHFDKIAVEYDYWKKKNHTYYSALKDFVRRQVPSGSLVVEFGCATGDILAATEPAQGLGIDNSLQMIERAIKKYPHLRFIKADVGNLQIEERFDYMIMADILDHTCEIEKTIKSANKILNQAGKIVISTLNPLWGPAISLCDKLKLKMPEGPHYFVPLKKMTSMVTREGFKIETAGYRLLCPIAIPLLSDLLNNHIARWPLFSRFCFVQCIVASKISK